MNNLRSLPSLFFLLLVPVFSFLWHNENLQMPISDSVEYIDSAYSIYLFFHNSEYLNFIVSIFNERGWRPVAFQLFIVPFLIASSGNILLSVLMTHVFFNSLSAFFIYKILCKYILDKNSVIISTLVLSLSFNVLFGGQPLPLFAEIAFISFLLGTIYFLLKTDLFRNKKDSRLFTIFLILTLLTRPVEGVLFLIPAIIVFTWKKYSAYVTLREILSGISYPIFFVWLLFISRVFPEISSSVIKIDPPYSQNTFISLTIFFSILLFTIFLLSQFLKVKKDIFYKSPQTNFYKKSLFLSSIILWIWYTPRFGSLYGWVYDTSIGDTFNYLKKDIPQFSDLFISILQNNGSIVIYLILLLLIINMFQIFIFEKKISQNIQDIRFKTENLLILLLSALPLPIILYFTTFQITYRKISPVIVILLLYGLIIIFQNKKITVLSNTLLGALLLLQSSMLSNVIFNNEEILQWGNQNKSYIEKITLGYQFPQPINSKDNRYENLIRFLLDEKEKGSFRKITLVFRDYEYPIERYLFQFLCKKNKIESSFFYPKIFNKDSFEEILDHETFLVILPKKYYSIFSEDVTNDIEEYLDKNKGKMSISDSNVFSFLFLLSANKLSNHNYDPKKCYNLIDDFQACLITKQN